MRFRGGSLLIALGLLSGCSERVIVSAGDVLVVAEDIETASPITTATIHYLLASPQPLSEEPGAPLVARLLYEAEFDCAASAWGDRRMETTLTDGQVVSSQSASIDMSRPTPGSIGDDVLRAVCDPKARAAKATRRPLKSIQQDFLDIKSNR